MAATPFAKTPISASSPLSGLARGEGHDASVPCDYPVSFRGPGCTGTAPAVARLRHHRDPLAKTAV